MRAVFLGYGGEILAHGLVDYPPPRSVLKLLPREGSDGLPYKGGFIATEFDFEHIARGVAVYTADHQIATFY